QSRLGALYRRLGEEPLAEQYERAYLEAFRRRMHRPTFADAVVAASVRYLPLHRLRALRFRSSELPPEPTPRQHAVASALVGDAVRAREALVLGGEPLDRKYLA